LIAGLAGFFMALGCQTNLFLPGPLQLDTRLASLKINLQLSVTSLQRLVWRKDEGYYK